MIYFFVYYRNYTETYYHGIPRDLNTFFVTVLLYPYVYNPNIHDTYIYCICVSWNSCFYSFLRYFIKVNLLTVDLTLFPFLTIFSSQINSRIYTYYRKKISQEEKKNVFHLTIVQENQKRVELNGAHYRPTNADDTYWLGENIDTAKKNLKNFLTSMSSQQNSGQKQIII